MGEGECATAKGPRCIRCHLGRGGGNWEEGCAIPALQECAPPQQISFGACIKADPVVGGSVKG